MLAKTGNSLPIVLGEEVKLENSLSNIWGTHEIDLKEFGLEMTLISSVCLECFQKEGGALLNLVELEEHVDNLISLSLWWTLISI